MKHLAMVLLILSVAVGHGRACTCLPVTVASSFSRSSDVFVGTVLSVHRDSGIKARVRIERSWKGTPAGKVVNVFTSSSGASCGVDMVAHHQVILFASRQTEGKLKGELTVGLCSFSGPYPQMLSQLGDSLGPPVTVRK